MQTISKTFFLIICLALAAVFMAAQPAMAQNQDTPPGDSGWYCPWCGGGGGYQGDYGGYHMGGRGMMPRGQHMMRRNYYDSYGQMGPGWGRGNPDAWDRPAKPLEKNDAKALLRNSVSGNPNLKVGEIDDKGDYYVGTIVTKDGSLVDKVQIDKETGWFRTVR